MSPTGEPRRLGLEVRFDAEPIRGRIYDDDAHRDRAFSGWLGLLAALDEVARGEPTHTWEVRES